VGKQETVAGSHGFVLGEPAPALDLAALHQDQGVDIALVGSKLRHKIVVALERGQILPTSR
jgi:hypothetical protein